MFVTYKCTLWTLKICMDLRFLSMYDVWKNELRDLILQFRVVWLFWDYKFCNLYILKIFVSHHILRTTRIDYKFCNLYIFYVDLGFIFLSSYVSSSSIVSVYPHSSTSVMTDDGSHMSLESVGYIVTYILSLFSMSTIFLLWL